MSVVIIDNQKLASMLASPEFRKEFAFLDGAQKSAAEAQKKRCSKCGRKNRSLKVDYEALKKHIGKLPVEKKARLKTMLGASQVQVMFINNSNKRVKMSF